MQRSVLAALLIVFPILVGQAGAQLDEVLGTEIRSNDEAARSQQRIDRISDDTEALLVEFRQVSERIDSLRVYNKQVEGLIQSQETELVELQEQIDNVTVLEREILPLMLRMVESLDQFVALDVPFLEKERRDRVAFVRGLLGRSDASVAEKYRRLLEAWQIENEYGRTIEEYSGEMQVGGTTRIVDFLRIGRVALIYQTRDGELSGAWDQKQQSWVDLGDEYRAEIRAGLRMARKQAAPDLLRLPIPAPQKAERRGPPERPPAGAPQREEPDAAE
jgi:hypothetical protein